jgi:Tfp pilus assembly protein PilO
MKRGNGLASVGLVTGVALLMLIAGVAVDVLLVQPQVTRLRELTAERDRLQANLASLEGRELESRKLAAYFGGDTLSVALTQLTETTPISYLAELVEQAGLRRRELGTLSTSETKGVFGTHCFLRAHGSFQRIWEFVRLLESSSRLVAVEAVSIKPVPESSWLEIRMNVSIYDPPEGS